MSRTECFACGHPDSRHRIVDTIRDRIEGGEPMLEVLEDYGWTVDEFERIAGEVEKVGGTSK